MAKCKKGSRRKGARSGGQQPKGPGPADTKKQTDEIHGTSLQLCKMTEEVSKVAACNAEAPVKAMSVRPTVQPVPQASDESLQAPVKTDGEAGMATVLSSLNMDDTRSPATASMVDMATTGQEGQAEAATPSSCPSSPRPDVARASSSSLDASSSCCSPSGRGLSGSGATEVPTWTAEEGGPIDTPLPQHDLHTHPTTPTTHHGQHEQSLSADVTDVSHITAEQCNAQDTQTEHHVYTTTTMQGVNDTAAPPTDGTFYANTQHQQIEQPGYYQQQTSPHLLFASQGQGHVYPPPLEYGPPGYIPTHHMPMPGLNQGPCYEQQAPFGECNVHGMMPPLPCGIYTYGPDNGYAQPAAYGYPPQGGFYNELEQHYGNQYGYMAPPPVGHDINYGQGQAYMPPQQCHAPHWHPYNDNQGPAQHQQHPDLVCFDHNGCVIEPPAVFDGQCNSGYAPPAVYPPHPMMMQQQHNMAHEQYEYAYAHPGSYGLAPASMMPQYGHPMDMPYPNAWQPMPSQLPGVPYYTPEGFPGDSEPFCNYMHTPEGDVYNGDVYDGQMPQPTRRRHRRRHNRKGGKGRKPVAAF